MNEASPQPLAGEDWVTRYERLRKDMLGQTTGASFGLVIFLRQGMTAWMRACADITFVPTSARESIQPLHATTCLPGGVRSQAAVILAGILLHHPKEANLCKAICTR